MFKSMKRAERRWKSYCAWMRRLKQDQNEHGTQWNWSRVPVERRGLSPEGQCSIWAQTDLCACFYDPKAMARFKDTPTQDHSNRRCGCKYDRQAAQRKVLLKLPLEVDSWKKRQRKKGSVTYVHRCCSDCGRSLGRIRKLVGGRDLSCVPPYCRVCEGKKQRPRILWFNGRRVDLPAREG